MPGHYVLGFCRSKNFHEGHPTLFGFYQFGRLLFVRYLFIVFNNHVCFIFGESSHMYTRVSIFSWNATYIEKKMKSLYSIQVCRFVSGTSSNSPIYFDHRTLSMLSLLSSSSSSLLSSSKHSSRTHDEFIVSFLSPRKVKECIFEFISNKESIHCINGSVAIACCFSLSLARNCSFFALVCRSRMRTLSWRTVNIKRQNKTEERKIGFNVRTYIY